MSDSLYTTDHMKRGPWPSPPSPGPFIPIRSTGLEGAARIDVVTVGDLGSDARGTGARKSAGKFEWHQLPWFALDGIEEAPVIDGPVTAYDVISMLGGWQQRIRPMVNVVALMLRFIEQTTKINGSSSPNLRVLEQTVRVLEFGAKKYAVGNWAKGMPWSVCFSCAMSHLTSITKGEEYDAESGLPHSAHAMCNLLFLRAYERLYREGDDRIPQFNMAGAEEEPYSHISGVTIAGSVMRGVDVITGDHA